MYLVKQFAQRALCLDGKQIYRKAAQNTEKPYQLASTTLANTMVFSKEVFPYSILPTPTTKGSAYFL